MKNSTFLVRYALLLFAFAFLSTKSYSQTSEVIVTVNWPTWSGENYVFIYNPGGTLIGQICDPGNCYTGSNTTYSTTLNLGCQPDGANYFVVLWDRYGDGWNGAASNITITSGGTTVLTDSGNLASTTGYGPLYFNVSGGGGACVSAPEIDIQGNGVSIADGDTTPAVADDTDFGSTGIGTPVARTFTIQNTGSAALNLTGGPFVTLSGSTEFNVTAQPTSPVAASGNTTFTVTYNPTNTGVDTATVSIANDDSDENPYTFDIQGNGLSANAEMDVQGNGTSIADGDVTPSTADDTDFGSVALSGSSTITYTIENQGFANLSLTGAPLVTLTGSGDFNVALQPTSPVTGGGTTTFQITYTPSALGTVTANVSIANNDSDENPYNFTIQGTGVNANINIYCQDFDSGASGWSAVTTTNGSWLEGTEGTMSGGATGNYAYSQRFSGNYQNSTFIDYQSPSIDLTGYENVRLQIDYNVDTQTDRDFLNVFASADGGTTWYRIGHQDAWEGTNWYNSTWTDTAPNPDVTYYGWTGNSGWTTAEIDLESQGVDNNANVLFRVQFESNASTTDVGVAFDNFCIVADPIATKTYVTCGPAGIGNDLELWLRADAEIGNYADGASVSQWTDQAFGTPLTNAYSSGTEMPTFYNNASQNVNFNPVISFDGNDAMYGKKGFFNDDIYIVVRPTNATSSTSPTQDVFCGDWYTEVPANQDITGIAIGNTSARFTNDIVAYNQGAQTNYGKAVVSTALSYDNVVIFNARKNATGTMDLFFDGLDLSVLGVVQEVNVPTYSDIMNARYWLGRSEFWGASLDGDIVEVIVYSDVKSAAEKNRIESYLALKYGVALGIDGDAGLGIPHIPIGYVDSSSNNLWDLASNAGYTFNVSGIGRDDCGNLNQKQSRSIDPGSVLTIGLGDIYNTNSANPNSFTDDLDFLMWGSDGGPMTASATPISVNLGPTTVTTLTDVAERIWKVTEIATTDITTAKVSVATADLVSLPALSGNDAYVMILADDDAFTTGIETVFLQTNGANQEAYYDFDGTKYFTFGVAHETLADRHMEFDGIDNYARVGDNVDLSGPFSISAWVYSRGSNNNNDEKTIISKRGSGTDGYHFYLRDDNRLEMRFDSGGSDQITSNTTLNDGQWRHVAFTFDGSNARLYIDGVLDNTEAMNAPTANAYNLCIGGRWIDKGDQRNFFIGNLEEIRIWDTALSAIQLRYIMNQEIEQDGSGNVDGEILPVSISRNDINAVPWSDLLAYYNMNSYIGTHLNDVSGNANRASLVVPDNFSLADQTAPLPYVSASASAWTTSGTWANGSDMYVPNSTLTINGTATVIDWNIVSIGHNVTMSADKTVLGMLSTAGELSVTSDRELRVTHYLELDGIIDLEGESQLIQETDSDLAVSSSGYIERDQQGIADSYTYNYWGSPVGRVNTTTNNTAYALTSTLFDGTNPSIPAAINYQAAFNAADSGPTSPITISSYWMYRFVNSTADDITAWNYVGSSGNITVGEGFTMKGAGTGTVTQEQNFIFAGKPNNGTITLPLGNGNEYLVGNPYPSAIDANEFISDNTDTNGALYFWQHWGGSSHNIGDYQGGYAVYNLAGGVPAASHPDVDQTGSGTKTPTRYIPVAQGFFVVDDTANPAGGNVVFENDQRVFRTEGSGDSMFIRNSETTERAPDEEEDERMKFRIGFDSPGELHRQLLLTIDETSTSDVDWAFDARLNEEQYDDMYWMINDGKYLIQAVPDAGPDRVLPIGITVTREGDASIGIDELENVSDDVDIYLHDKITDTYHDLRLGAYDVFLTVGNHSDRFDLQFYQEVLSIDDPILGEDLTMNYFSSLDAIRITNNSSNVLKTATLFNILGQEVKTWELVSETSQDLNVNNIRSGSYILKLQTETTTLTKKFIIE